MRARHAGAIGLGLFSLLITFQNCAPQTFTNANSSLLEFSSLSAEGEADQVVTLEMNHPKEFVANLPLNALQASSFYLSFTPNQTVTEEKTAHGVVQILDAASLTLRFTPEFGFRGNDKTTVYLYDSYGNEIHILVRFIVGDSLGNFQPALAVRGTACLTCHAQVTSNMVTDFGYLGDGKGKDYFFGANAPEKLPWNDGSIYGDDDAGRHTNDEKPAYVNPGSWATMTLAATSTVYVPQAQIPSGPAQMFSVNTLAEYLRHRLKASGIASSKAASVVEKQSIFIGAPTADRLREAFQTTQKAMGLIYYPNSDSAAALKGLGPHSKGTYFTNTGDVTCEGDLFLDGPLYLKNLNLLSKTGCRLYVTGSVFLSGPIRYLSADAQTNLQITSSKAILMGLGSVFKDGILCDTNGYYYARQTEPSGSVTNKQTIFASSLTHRLQIAVDGIFTRSGIAPTDLQKSIQKDADLVGSLLDATCDSTGRSVAFDRILLNAPIVHSRYNGNISGTIIAEYSLMSLGSFKFSYDPVFSTVPILPFLHFQDYFHVD